MKEHPIIMSGESVRAILEGRKTQTRRPVRGVEWMSPTDWNADVRAASLFCLGRLHGAEFNSWIRAPWQPGDVLWVREGFAVPFSGPLGSCPYDTDVAYRAEAELVDIENPSVRWRSPSHMPRWASRIDLVVTEVRVERLQEISAEDAWAEGCIAWDEGVRLDQESIDEYADAWDALNARRGFPWESNPWVWVNTFKRKEGNHA